MDHQPALVSISVSILLAARTSRLSLSHRLKTCSGSVVSTAERMVSEHCVLEVLVMSHLCSLKYNMVVFQQE